MPTTTPTRRGVQLTVTIDPEVKDWLRKQAPGRHTLGQTVNKHLHMAMAREEERQRLAAAACTVCGEGGQ